MSLQAINKHLATIYGPIVNAIRAGEAPDSLHLRRAARLPVIVALHASLKRPLLLITSRADRALTFYEELALWAPGAPRLLFPEPNPLFYENAAWGERTRRDRLTTLTTLASYHIPGVATSDVPPIIITAARALITRTMSRREFLKATQTLYKGHTISPETLARRLITLGYEHVNTVISPGQFARRGGLLDLWPPAEKLPSRLEFFGDEIDTIRSFDPTTQRTTQSLKRIILTPAKEFLLPETENDLPEELTEFYIPVFHPSPASLLDYLPRQTLICFDDFQDLEMSVTEIEEQALTLRRDALQEGLISADFPLPHLTWTDIIDTLPRYQSLELGSYSLEKAQENNHTPQNIQNLASQLAERFIPGPRYGGRLKLFIEELSETLLHGHRVTIVSRQAARLQDLWKEQRYLTTTKGQQSSERIAPEFIQGSLTEGWVYRDDGQDCYCVYTDGEIFGWRRPEPRQRQRPVAESPEAHYADLQAGDFVVHIDHGVGVFTGLVNRTIDGFEREYLCIEYADEAQLFVPVHQADRITRYVGPGGRLPALSRLGGVEWKNIKSHVKEAVQEVAEDLLDLYAQRSVIQGHAFGPDTAWQHELEASFPYIETTDQMRVLAEVKQDMETTQPMDRLICGDVGYGKTEVALRAAFKAVMDGKQVAMLVPTTVLAQQHFQTFRQRLAAFPVEVEMLSRFRTPHQQREIIKRLHQGKVDIIIGTHRLLSSDVDFKDLGLLIIDEEQRFGVTHKETLKRMRTEVDVLTLTATPIPRTLYMTLTGVRDISTINTPPEERLPIITHIGPYTPKMVRQAILRELERGGQVFFVHNRVQTIGAMQQHLLKLVPEARITIAHGQMPEKELSAHMKAFTRGEVDVLLCTSIIESGLDIPNANTLIVDRADMFGLAQLYQLRGRVGRGAQRAYAYFFRHARRQPTPEGRQRLETIAENTQLGAGFSIAMRDLEIRGAGDILGTRQHGHIAAVGFHLYTRLLAEAVQRLRSQTDIPIAATALTQATPIPTPINVDLPIPASIPPDYVSDKDMRLRLYRRLADMQTIEEIDALEAEFSDRFGPPPEEIHNLLYQMKIKLYAIRAGLSSISSENGQLVLRYPEWQIPERLPPLDQAVRVGKTALWIAYQKMPDWRQSLLRILLQLSASQTIQQAR